MANQDINLQQHLAAALDIVNQASSEQTGGQWLENLTTDVAPQINEPVVKAVLGAVVKLLRRSCGSRNLCGSAAVLRCFGRQFRLPRQWE